MCLRRKKGKREDGRRNRKEGINKRKEKKRRNLKNKNGGTSGREVAMSIKQIGKNSYVLYI